MSYILEFIKVVILFRVTSFLIIEVVNYSTVSYIFKSYFLSHYRGSELQYSVIHSRVPSLALSHYRGSLQYRALVFTQNIEFIRVHVIAECRPYSHNVRRRGQIHESYYSSQEDLLKNSV